MDVILHKHMECFEKIWPEWKTLQDEFHEITIFQDINWMKSWWDYKSKQTKITPYMIEIKENDKTIGIIPLYRSNIRFAGLKFRLLRPIGSELSDYLIPILSKKYSPDTLLNLAFAKIYEDKINWDYIDWGEVPEESLFAQFLNKQLLRKSKWLKRERITVCPALILNGDIEEITSKYSKKFLKEILKNENKLKTDGNLQYSKVMTKQEIEPVMNTFFKLHCERWGNTDTPSKFRHQEERDYAMQLAKNLFKDNLLQLTYLSYNNEIVVVAFSMSDGKKSYLYLHSMNIKYKKYSPAHILTYYLILEAYREGFELVDFLRGDEKYKQKWGTVDKFNVQYKFFNRSIMSILYKSIFHPTHSNKVIVNYLKPLAKRFLAKPVEQ